MQDCDIPDTQAVNENSHGMMKSICEIGPLFEKLHEEVLNTDDTDSVNLKSHRETISKSIPQVRILSKSSSMPSLLTKKLETSSLPKLSICEKDLTKKTVASRKLKVAKLPDLTPSNVGSRKTSISITPKRARSSFRSYRYKVYPGNNSRVILQTLRIRSWWHNIPAPMTLKFDNDTEYSNDIQASPQFIWQMYKNNKHYQNDAFIGVLLNHLENNGCLVSKKGLYYSLKDYCLEKELDITTIIPQTFYLTNDTKIRSKMRNDNDEFRLYNESLGDKLSNNKSVEDVIWILKPASHTNRGFGIKVVRGLSQVMEIINRVKDAKESNNQECQDEVAAINQNTPASSNTTNIQSTTVSEKLQNLSRAASRMASINGWIVQRYMTNPLLVDNRKFDIRCFVLVTQFEKSGFCAYFYDDMYIRTSSKRFSMNKLSDRETHLTNDAVQKYSKSYGKYESGNKLTTSELQVSISRDYPNAPANVVEDVIIPNIKRLARLSIEATTKILSDTKIANSFELFGYDFMIYDDFQPCIIEVNTNPCLEFACPLLTEVITSVIQSTMRLSVDKLFPPPNGQKTKQCQDAVDSINRQENKFKRLYP